MRKAFTLVELLVVVAIIVILISILMPSLEEAVAIAQRAKCMSNERQVINGGNTYAIDNRGSYLPVVTYGWDYQMLMPGSSQGYNVDNFVAYLQTQKVFYCPSHGAPGWANPPEQLWEWQTYQMSITGNTGNSHIKHLVDYWLYFLDGHNAGGALRDGPYKQAEMPTFGGAPGSTTALTCWTEGIDNGTAQLVSSFLHGRKGLATAFVDGHAEYVPRAELVYDSRSDSSGWLKAVRAPWIGSTSRVGGSRPVAP